MAADPPPAMAKDSLFLCADVADDPWIMDLVS